MMLEINIFQELFMSTEVWGYLGPLALVVAGLFFVKKERVLFIFFFLIDALFAYNYLQLISTDGLYIWHSIIMLFGALFTLVYPLWGRSR